MQLTEQIGIVMQILQANSGWVNDKLEPYWFFQLAPNIHTEGTLQEIGKLSEWRASIDKGYSLDDIKIGRNFFGITPEQAMGKLIEWLMSTEHLLTIENLSE